MDPRLAYDPADYGLAEGEFTPGDYSKAPRRVYLTEFAVNELFPGWWPSLILPNGIGNRSTTNVSIGVWPDGRVGYAESFYATVETPMALRRFPFDKQALEIFIHPFVYERDEPILVPRDRLARTWEQNTGIAEWPRRGVAMTERPVEFVHFDDSTSVVSEFVVTIGIDPQPMHVLVSIVLPLIMLVLLTFSVFWMDQEGLSDRVNIQFRGTDSGASIQIRLNVISASIFARSRQGVMVRDSTSFPIDFAYVPANRDDRDGEGRAAQDDQTARERVPQRSEEGFEHDRAVDNVSGDSGEKGRCLLTEVHGRLLG